MNYEIRTDRLLLRPPVPEDAEELFSLMADKELTTFLTWEPHSDISVTAALLNNLIESQKSDRGYHWCVCLDNRIIGLISLIDVRRKIRTWTLNRAELSYWTGRKYQGRGYATEGSRGVIQFGFEKLGLHKIIVAHADENIESQRICKKLGFNQYAHELDAFMKDLKWHNLIWYELICSGNEMD